MLAMSVLMHVCMQAQSIFKECLVPRISDLSTCNIENVGMAWGQGYFKVRPTIFDIHVVILLSYSYLGLFLEIDS